MAYTITAYQKGEPVHASRLQKSSAAVLAMKWMEAGYTDVAITNEVGLKFSLRDFQTKYLAAWRGVWRQPAI